MKRLIRTEDLEGKRLGNALIIKRVHIPELGEGMTLQPFFCKCDCGNFFLSHKATTFNKYHNQLNNEKFKFSCGCKGDPRRRIHRKVGSQFLDMCIKKYSNLVEKKIETSQQDLFNHTIKIIEKEINIFVFIKETGYVSTQEEIKEAEAFIIDSLKKKNIDVSNIKFETFQISNEKIAYGCKIKFEVK